MYSVTILIDCRINYAMQNHIETGTLIFHSQLVSIKKPWNYTIPNCPRSTRVINCTINYLKQL